jgi:hypothetical protein
MMVESEQSRGTRALLGLRPPAELAEGSVSTVQPQRQPTGEPATATPPRPAYTKISSGWDAEDQEPRGKGSDIVTALRAVGVLVVVVGVIALLLR